MDLQIADKLFIVTGASDGLGYGVARTLLQEKARVIVVARSAKRTNELEKDFPGLVEILFADVTTKGFPDALINLVSGRELHGIFINAGGPPAGIFTDLKIEEWDKAYETILRWKIALLQKVLPVFTRQKYGRIILSESISVKQPIPNLVLSNSLRAAVTGMASTLAKEIAPDHVTVNVLAPGYHDTSAVVRLGKPKQEYEKEIPVRRMGHPEEFGRIAAWLLSPLSAYITGQTISVDGGLVKGIFG